MSTERLDLPMLVAGERRRGHGMVALEEQFELHTISSRRPGA